MLLVRSVPARLRRSSALVAGAAVLVSGAVVTVASPAGAALGAPSVSPSSGDDSTSFGGSLANAACPAGTDDAFWSLEGGTIQPGAAFLGASTNPAGTGPQEFQGASVANIETVLGAPLADGTYYVQFSCYNGATLAESYRANFSYSNAGAGSWAIVTSSVPAAPAKPAVSAPTTGGAVSVSWTAPANGGSAITGYVVKAYVGSSNVKTVPVGNVTSTTVTGLSNGTTYTFTVAAVNGVGTGPESVESNAVTPRLATKLVIASAPVKLTYGVAYKVVGKLTRSNGTTAVPSQYVYLQVRKKGTTTYASVVKALSSSTGTASLVHKPAYAIDALRLYYPTTGGNLGSVSAAKTVSTQRRISAAWSDATITLGRTTALRGSLYPRAVGVRITLQRKVGTSWRTVTYKTLPSTTASYSSYSFSVKPPARGKHYYRVVVAAGHNYVATVRSAPVLSVA